MGRDRIGRRGEAGRAVPFGPVAVVLLAALAVGCRDDGNDRFVAGAPAATSNTPIRTDGDDAAPTDDAASGGTDTVVDDQVSSDSTGSTGAGGTRPSAGDDASGDIAPGAPAATSDEPASTDTPDSTPPPAATSTSTSTTTTTTVPPIDAATLAFCEPFVTAQTMLARGPAVDVATATPEEIVAAADEHAAVIAPLLDAALAAAPAAVVADVDAVIGAMRASLSTGADPSADADYAAADERVDVHVAASCGYETVAVSAVEYAFENVPSTLRAGRTTFELTNAGAEVHEMLVFRIHDDVTETLDELLALPEEEALTRVTFAGALSVVPGGVDTETLELAAGRYAALCFVPVGTTDPAVVDDTIEAGPPHVAEGMHAEFTVG